MNTICPWCEAPRDTGPSCPSCGANYAKALLIKTHGRAAVEPSQPPALRVIEIEERLVDDPQWEYRCCVMAIPAALLAALAFNLFPFGRFLQRMFFGMPLHELGHALAGWFCGYAALPTPFWFTVTQETRGLAAPVLLLGAIGWMVFRAHQARLHGFVWLGTGLVLLQSIGTLSLKPEAAKMLITFSGDGIGMVLGTTLMCMFFFGRSTQLYKGSLRWGLLPIGAAAYVDMFATWVRASRDFAHAPVGENEGRGLSDAAVLMESHHWSTDQLTGRHVAVGVVCLLALMAVYAWGVWRAKRELCAFRAT